MKITRRQLILASLGFGTAGLGSFGYMYFIESSWLELTQKELEAKRIKSKKAFRILHLADLHATEGASYQFLEKAFAIGIKQKPDIICLTGDYITTKLSDEKNYQKILKKLSNCAPTFACYGNHDGTWTRQFYGTDYSDELRELFGKSNITLLCNQKQTIEVKQQKIIIAGLGDLWCGDVNPQKTLSFKRKEDIPIIVLAHNPDTKEDIAHYDWDLMLSGHTHGGQFRIPFTQSAPFAPVKDKRYVEGLHTWNNKYIHITRGVGNVVGVRFNCRPEMSVLDVVV